jgi:hypothetical protein
MKLGNMTIGDLVRLCAVGVLLFGIWGLVIGVAMTWVEDTWPSDDRRHVSEAELRPDRLHFRPVEGSLPPAAQAGTIYVPVYSTVYLGHREVQAGMAVTLSIRNTSPNQELLVHRLDYYDTDGKVVTSLAERPHAVPAMATAEFFIDRRDPIGGSGANYLIEWSVPEGGTAPLVETIMVGRMGGTGITFVGRGVAVQGGVTGPR